MRRYDSYTSMLRGMYRSKSERISPDQLALFLAQLPANETTTPPDEPEPPPAPEPSPSPVAGDGDPPAPGPKAAKPRRGGRKPVPPSMRREVVKVRSPTMSAGAAMPRSS